jgi:hypothetical protein
MGNATKELDIKVFYLCRARKYNSELLQKWCMCKNTC